MAIKQTALPGIVGLMGSTEPGDRQAAAWKFTKFLRQEAIGTDMLTGRLIRIRPSLARKNSDVLGIVEALGSDDDKQRSHAADVFHDILTKNNISTDLLVDTIKGKAKPLAGVRPHLVKVPPRYREYEGHQALDILGKLIRERGNMTDRSARSVGSYWRRQPGITMTEDEWKWVIDLAQRMEVIE